MIYAVPYLFGALPGHYQKMAVLSLILVPISWAYAILRYRLMDVDIIFQQGYVYTLAALAAARHLLWPHFLVHKTRRSEPRRHRRPDPVRHLRLSTHSQLGAGTAGPLFLL